MSNNILNNQESFTRTKKKLKKILEEKGLNLTLCETSDILAKALGFKNTFDLNKNYFEYNQIKNLQKVEGAGYNENHNEEVKSIINKTPEGLQLLEGKNINGMSHNQKEAKKDIQQMLKKALKNLKGNIVISGKVGSGVSTIIDEVLIFDNKKILTINDTQELFYIKGDARSKEHLNEVISLNKEGKNVVFGIHGNSKETALSSIHFLESNFDFESIQYLFILERTSDGILKVYVYDMWKDPNKFKVFGIKWRKWK